MNLKKLQVYGRLSHINDLLLPPPPEENTHFDIFQNYEIQAKKREWN